MSDLNMVQRVVGKDYNIALFTVEGAVDANTSPNFEKNLLSVVDKGIYNILVDVANVNYISSAGLGAFMSVLDTIESKNANGKIAIINCSRQFEKVFTMMGFDEVFESFDSVDEALNLWEKK